MIINRLLIITVFFSFFSYEIRGQTYVINSDTIKFSIAECEGRDNVKNYTNFNGLHFSNFYTIIDSTKININADSINDYILILSPLAQEYGKDTLPCDVEKGKRLFVVLLSKGNRYKIDFVTENLIPNVYEYQSDPFTKLKKVNNVIKLTLFTGSIIKCKYYYDIKAIKGELYLMKSGYECYKTDLSESEKRNFIYHSCNKVNLRTINIHDFMPEPKLK